MEHSIDPETVGTSPGSRGGHQSSDGAGTKISKSNVGILSLVRHTLCSCHSHFIDKKSGRAIFVAALEANFFR